MLHTTANLLPVLIVCLIYAILTAVSTLATLLLVKVPEHDAQVVREIERMNHEQIRKMEMINHDEIHDNKRR